MLVDPLQYLLSNSDDLSLVWVQGWGSWTGWPRGSWLGVGKSSSDSGVVVVIEGGAVDLSTPGIA